MLCRRSSFGAAILDNKIYAIGGNDGTLCMANSERYDPVKNAWENIASLQNRRSALKFYYEYVNFSFETSIKSELKKEHTRIGCNEWTTLCFGRK